MSRQERANMITFIEKVKGYGRNELMVMTDADIEYIYNRTYDLYEINE
ncbi:BH0509 family protein [Desertibacillus haloalkaliphilus]|nr:BH0509 family protein [Desertibacillus haloalkaliphilus]MBU8908778.1 BH0509 family protein [Desertibacillus haloalkaliphilus]